MKKSTLRWLLRLALGTGLLVLLLFQFGTRETWTRLLSADPLWLVAVFVLPHLGMLLSTLKWKLLLQAGGAHLSLGRLFSLYLIGTFFNNFLPSTFGGDVVRGYELSRSGVRPAHAASSTIVERALGFVAMVGLVPLSLITFDGDAASWLLRGVLPLAAVALAFWGFFRSLRLPGWLRERGPRLVHRVTGAIQRVLESAGEFRDDRRVLFVGFLLSLAFYLNSVVVVWLASRAIGVTPTFLELLSIVPLVLLVGAVPVTVNGLGLIEGGYVALLSEVGIGQPEALSIALILRARLLLTSVIGGVVFMALKRSRPEGASRTAP